MLKMQHQNTVVTIIIIKVTKYIAALNIYGKIFQLHPREKTNIVVFQLHV